MNAAGYRNIIARRLIITGAVMHVETAWTEVEVVARSSIGNENLY